MEGQVVDEKFELSETITGRNGQEDDTDVRESGPLESNDPKSSTGMIETFTSAGLTQRNNIAEVLQ